MSDPNIDRAEKAFAIRQQQARFQRDLPLPDHPTNGDEDTYDKKIANYSKGLPHNELGEVDLAAYGKLITALTTGKPADFEAIPMGEPNLTKRRKFVNPQAGLAFDLEGADSHHLSIPAPPTFSSAEQAGEMVENYWMALTRDVPFTNYDRDSLTIAAVEDLSKLSDFRGPKVKGKVTPATLFRGLAYGETTGPYLSQFLLKTVPFGAETIEQTISTAIPNKNYMTTYDEWLSVQRGTKPPPTPSDSKQHFVHNGRDISQYVHIDVLFQAYFNACLILMAPVSDGGVGAPLNPGNPYVKSRNQEGFGLFGPPHIIGLLGQAAVQALKATWYQKWFVHRRLRPEVFGGRIHNHLKHPAEAPYPIHGNVLNSDALEKVLKKNGTALLPMAFTEGSPLHPSYGAGHATVGSACVTILKWFFDESHLVNDPVEVTPEGNRPRPYTGPDKDKLTVLGELNKLASNIGLGRNIAGVHWRSDSSASLKLGEDVAIRILQDFRATVNEDFDGCSFTKFDGTRFTV
jgi:hypothetical protein